MVDFRTRTTWSSWRSVVHPAVSEDEQYIFAQNHINHFDFVSMYPATRHYKQGLELETHFRYPVYGPFMESRGTIPVPAERSERLPAIKKHIASEVAAGRSILAFPEGTRTLNGRVGDFRKGVFVIARDLGLKVAPTAVTGGLVSPGARRRAGPVAGPTRAASAPAAGGRGMPAHCPRSRVEQR